MANEVSRSPAAPEAPHLRRVLGPGDLVLLFVVAIVNLNVVPTIAANGGVTVWLWSLALLLFFWPQGIAVIELAHRYPGEGGVYLWAKRVFGDFHGFLSGWCYWTNNIFYVPTVLLYFVGISVYVAGPRARTLADNHLFALGASIVLLVLLVALNVRGLGVGKWINNLGGIGTSVTAIMLIGLGLVVLFRFGTTMTAADFRITGDLRLIGSFGIICFGLVGLELASIMGDEIQDPGRTLPGAVGWGGLLSGILYIGATLTLLLAVSKQDIGVLQGVVQAVSHMAEQVQVPWIVSPFALVLSISIAGIYMHGALLKLAKQSPPGEGYYSKTTLVLAGSCGLITTILGIGVAFIPSHQIESIRLFEIKMVAGTLFLVGLAAFFFFIYGRRKAARKLGAAPAL